MHTECKFGTATQAGPNPIALAQLRHHTRNTLHRVLLEVQEQAALCAPERERVLLNAVAERINHSVAIADALFGVTRAAAPFAERLQAICESTVALLADPEQALALDVAVEASCPPALEVPLLRAAQEFVANAVKHGMHLRLMGRITVRLAKGAAGGIELTVRDNGWGPHPSANAGEGLAILRELANEYGGSLALIRQAGETRARLSLPRARGR